VDTPIGRLLADGALDTSSLAITDSDPRVLLLAAPGAWFEEAALIGKYFPIFGRHLPGQLRESRPPRCSARTPPADDARPECRRQLRAGGGGDTQPVRRRTAVKKTQVGEVMTTAVVTAGHAMPCRDLAGLLYAKGIGGVPVTDHGRRMDDRVRADDRARHHSRGRRAASGYLPHRPPRWDRHPFRPAARPRASRRGDPRRNRGRGACLGVWRGSPGRRWPSATRRDDLGPGRAKIRPAGPGDRALQIESVTGVDYHLTRAAGDRYPDRGDLLVTAREGGRCRSRRGYSAPNFLISSNSASVSCRGTSSLATFAVCT
jgi:hypothetical protein